jgi:hypothetical protein
MMHGMPLPETPDDITPALLGRSLGLSVRSVDCEVIGEERGFTGVIARAHLRGEPDLPASIIVKLPMAPRASATAWTLFAAASDEAKRNHYARARQEIDFYRDIAPILGDAAPHAHALVDDPAALRLMLLLEDVASSRPGDVLEGCSTDDAATILGAIGPLHRWGWQRPLPDMPAWTGDPAAYQQRLRQRSPLFLERYGDRISPAIRRLIDRMGAGIAAMLHTLDAAPHTALHGDLHLDNVQFDVADDRPVVILDWQGVAHGPAVVDLIEIIAGSLPADAEPTRDTELLNLWHGSLPEPIRAAYPLARLADDFGRALVRRFAGIVGWLARADLQALNEREARITEAALDDGRFIGALQRHDVMRLLEG